VYKTITLGWDNNNNNNNNNNNKVKFQNIIWGMDWNDLPQDRHKW
jgi:hypothetical protein